MKRKFFSITIALMLLTGLCLVPALPAAGADGYDSSLILENKDGDWLVIPSDDISGLLEYNSPGPEFEYQLTVTGLEDSVDYSIIYYADKDSRFDPDQWGGDNPGAVIGTFTYDVTPKVTSGSKDLGMSLPCPPDANISLYNYGTDPSVPIYTEDDYEHAHGAKIWVVPTSALTTGLLPVIVWAPSSFLFETDLVTYTDTGGTVPADSTATTVTGNAATTATTGSGGPATVEITEYTDPPAEGAVFGALGTYVDVHCDNPENLTEVIIKVDYEQGSMLEEGAEELAQRIYYWNSTVSAWRECSDQSVYTGPNYIEATITASTTPTLDYLATSIFGAGSVTLELDDWYASGDTVAVTIEDAGQSGVIAAFAWSDTVGPDGKITFALSETTDPGVFEGSFDLVSTTPGAGELLVNDGDHIFVTYIVAPGEDPLVGIATVDNVLPVITVVSPLASANITAIMPLIKANYSDVGSAVDNATAVMTLNTITVTPDVCTPATIEYTPSASDNLSDGIYTVTVDVDDLAGNAAKTKSWSFTVDNTDPVITPPAATPDLFPPGVKTQVTFTATVNDAHSGVNTVAIDLSSIGTGLPAAKTMLDNGVAPDVTVGDHIYTTSANITEADQEVYLLLVTATDYASNQASANITVTVSSDSTKPVISDPDIAYPFAGVDSARPGDTVAISANVTDDVLMGTVTATCTAFAAPIDLLDNGVNPDATLGDDIYSANATVASGAGWGDYTITIAAEDDKGNEAIPDKTLTLVVVSGATGYELDLVEGWNLVSLPLIPDSDNISMVISATTLASANVSNIAGIRAYDPATGEFPYYVPDTGSGDLAVMEDGVGYWVFMEADDTLTITGVQWPTPPAIPPTYNVVAGWNLIGFKSLVDLIDDVYLASLLFYEDYDTYPVLWSYNAIAGAYENVKGEPLGMEVGHGFWIWMTEAMVIVPPG